MEQNCQKGGQPSGPLPGALEGRYTIETIDVVQDFEAAVENNILVTPALILVAPLPRVVILGNLNDLPKVLPLFDCWKVTREQKQTNLSGTRKAVGRGGANLKA